MADVAGLIKLCRHVETLAYGSAAGMTLTDEDLTHIEQAIFPSLPDAFSLALTDVPLEPSGFGSCVKAIACGTAIICPDIESDTQTHAHLPIMLALPLIGRTLPANAQNAMLRCRMRLFWRRSEGATGSPPVAARRVGGPCWIRTSDQRIKSPLLYQLS